MAAAAQIIHGVRQRLPGRRDRAVVRAMAQFTGATALEPGGPSGLFGRRGEIPVYPRLAAVDTLDFAETTLWSAEANALGAPIRKRLIGEAGAVTEIPDSSYDAVLASHVIEHLADPLGALQEWKRVLRPSGLILLVVPHREGTFDHRRPVTGIEHLRQDAAARTGEDDLTHLPEILELHDLDRDPGAPDGEAFADRCRQNEAIRGMHHHVFVTGTVAEMCAAADLGVTLLRVLKPFHIVCICTTEPGEGVLDDRGLAAALQASPFPSDRAA